MIVSKIFCCSSSYSLSHPRDQVSALTLLTFVQSFIMLLEKRVSM